LQGCLARTLAGHGQIVGIVGEAGIGKSRLLHEFRTTIAAGRVTWNTSYCVAYGQTTPYLPLFDLLRVTWRMGGGENPHEPYETIWTLAVRACQYRPQVVVMENLHWIDQRSEDYLATLFERLAGLPLLFVSTHRPGYTVRWADKTYYTQIALQGLNDREAETLTAIG
jgi:predicted ATPase